MSNTLTPAAANSNNLAYGGRQVTDPIVYTAYNSAILSAKYGAYEWINELLALWKASVANYTYQQTYTCIAGLNVGDPVYISANNTATLALATTAATAKVIGFCAYKPTTTSCYVHHFYYKSGLAGGTAGNPAYLSNAGAVATSAGTVSTVIGVYLSTTEAVLHADTLSSQGPTGPAGGDLSGAYPSPTVAKINGVTLGSTTATSGNLLIGSGSQWVTNAITGDITLSSAGVVGVTKINGATLGATTATGGNILIGSGTQWVTNAVTGDITITSGGVTAIGSGKVTNTMLAGAIDLTTKVTGKLPIANGGTNSNAALSNGRVMVSSGGAIVEGGLGTTGQFLGTNLSSVLAFQYPIQYTTKSASYTVLSTDSGTLIDVTVGAADRTITLPKASTVAAGFVVWVRKADTSTTNKLIIKSDGTTPDTINGIDQHTNGINLGNSSTVTNAVQTLNGQYATLGFISLGAANDWAIIDCAGEYLQASQTTPTNAPATGNWGDVTSLILPPGEWDISGAVGVNINSATLAVGGNFAAGISTTTGNSGTGLTEGENEFFANIQGESGQGDHASVAIPPLKVVVTAAAGTTFYLKINITFTSPGTPPQYTGRISARRIR